MYNQHDNKYIFKILIYVSILSLFHNTQCAGGLFDSIKTLFQSTPALPVSASPVVKQNPEDEKSSPNPDLQKSSQAESEVLTSKAPPSEQPPPSEDRGQKEPKPLTWSEQLTELAESVKRMFTTITEKPTKEIDKKVADTEATAKTTELKKSDKTTSATTPISHSTPSTLSLEPASFFTPAQKEQQKMQVILMQNEIITFKNQQKCEDEKNHADLINIQKFIKDCKKKWDSYGKLTSLDAQIQEIINSQNTQSILKKYAFLIVMMALLYSDQSFLRNLCAKTFLLYPLVYFASQRDTLARKIQHLYYTKIVNDNLCCLPTVEAHKLSTIIGIVYYDPKLTEKICNSKHELATVSNIQQKIKHPPSETELEHLCLVTITSYEKPTRNAQDVKICIAILLNLFCALLQQDLLQQYNDLVTKLFVWAMEKYNSHDKHGVTTQLYRYVDQNTHKINETDLQKLKERLPRLPGSQTFAEAIKQSYEE